MLISCNEDLQNGNQQEKTLINNVVPGTNPKATTGGGDTKPYTSGSGYDSPWEMGNLNMPVKYYFNSYLSWEGIYVRVTPYIGLAYYDGADDGSYFGTNISSYPNLYQGGKEYGNYIAANPIILDVNNSSSHELAIFSDYINGIANDHCPVMPTVYQYPYNWDPIYFDLVDNDIVKSDIWLPTPPIVPAPPKATMAEVHLLKDYGKVMYYKIEFSLGDPANYSDVAYVLSLEDISGSAIPINVTDVFGGDLYYHSGFEELVVDVNSPTFNIPFVRANAPISTSIGDFKAITSAGDIKSFVTLKVERN